MLEMIVWNLVGVALLAFAVKGLSWIPWLHRRPAVLHLLWLVVLIQLVVPAFVPIRILPTESSSLDVVAFAPRGTQANPTIDESNDQDRGSSRLLVGQSNDQSLEQEWVHEGPTRAEEQSPDVFGQSQASATASSSIDAAAAELRNNAAAPSDRVSTRWLGVTLCAVWVIGAVLMLARICQQSRRAGRVIALAQREPSLERVMNEVLADFGCRRSVPIRTTLAELSPALLGWQYPCVLMPRGTVQILAAEEVRAVIAHEVAHFIRRDHMTMAFANLVCAVMWWHPAAWWARHEMQVAQEYCADSMAATCGSNGKRIYAQTLWKVLNHYPKTRNCPAPASVGIGNHFSSRNMRRRFEMLAHRKKILAHSKWGGLMVACGVLVACCLPAQATVGNGPAGGVANETSAVAEAQSRSNRERHEQQIAEAKSRGPEQARQDDQDDSAQDQYSRELTLTVRRDNGAYGTSAFSFRFNSQELREHQNQVDLVYNRCGLLHVTAHGGMRSRVVDLGEVNFLQQQDVPEEGDWLNRCVQPVAGHVYVQEINDGRQIAYVKFKVLEIKQDGELSIRWSPLDSMKDWPSFEPGWAGTMGQCGGAHRVR